MVLVNVNHSPYFAYVVIAKCIPLLKYIGIVEFIGMVLRN